MQISQIFTYFKSNFGVTAETILTKITLKIGENLEILY